MISNWLKLLLPPCLEKPCAENRSHSIRLKKYVASVEFVKVCDSLFWQLYRVMFCAL
jgi:hypothetical protein